MENQFFSIFFIFFLFFFYFFFIAKNDDGRKNYSLKNFFFVGKKFSPTRMLAQNRFSILYIRNINPKKNTQITPDFFIF